MDSYRIELNLLDLRNARIEENHIIIPIIDNGIRLAKSKKDEEKMYTTLTCNVYPRKTSGSRGEVAIVKPSFTYEEHIRYQAGEEVKLPIIGNVLLKNDR